jgi:leucyl-tRNA synthetase
LKFGFYDFQSVRDWYREVSGDVGMHADLVLYWIRSAALLVTPVAPHFAEQIWSTVLQEPTSVQNALWPTPTTPVDPTVIEAGQYMRGTIKTIRDAEISLLKALTKAKGKKGAAASEALFDPKKPKAVRIYVATAFPEWQNTCVQIVKDSYVKVDDKVDDAKVKELLIEKGLIKDKRAMPFIQAFKVRFLFLFLFPFASLLDYVLMH